MKKYDTYKDSDNQWIGQVPEHWILSKIKYNFGIISGCGFKEKYQGEIEGDYPFCKASDINGMGKTISTARNYVTTKIVLKERYNIIPANSILFAKIGEALKKNHRKINTIECIVDNNCQALVPAKNQNTSYMYYLLTQIDMAWFDNAGTIPCVNNQKLKDFRIALPPLSEQQAIVEFLDKKTGKIDQSIALLETQKTDLQAYRQALITETVTKGLNPSAPMKDSGIQWIGEIPEGWEIVRLKHLLDGTLTYGANESAESDNKEWPRYIRITDIAENGSLKESTFKSLSPDKAENYLLQKGDVLFARSGATVGKTFLFEENISACFAGYLIKATPNKTKLNSRFLYFYTISNAYESWKNSVYIQSTIQNIGADKYSQLPVLTPPLSEQEAIATFLDKKTHDIDTAIEHINTQIADLKAYRTALISEAVTGKIDVR